MAESGTTAFGRDRGEVDLEYPLVPASPAPASSIPEVLVSKPGNDHAKFHVDVVVTGEPDRSEWAALLMMTSSDTAQSSGREAWIAAAKRALIQLGHSQVKIERLAAALKVTRGGFYWHFKNRADLLASLLMDWEATNSAAIIAALEAPGTPEERLRGLAEVWIEERSYSPAYDSAIRDWARVSAEAAIVVARVDARRIAALHGFFLDAGYAAAEALIRARITYYHQVGYHAMHLREPKATRRRNLPLYIRALLGSPGPLADEHD